MTRLPQSCERALLERFLRAEAMALRAVRGAQRRTVPARVAKFLRRHELDERKHLQRFERLLGRQSWDTSDVPSLPEQWWALAVHLFGYEALGLELAKILVGLRPDLRWILDDEERHVKFFERELGQLLSAGGETAECAKVAGRAWWRRLPRTLDRYLAADELAAYRPRLCDRILQKLEHRCLRLGLFEGVASTSVAKRFRSLESDQRTIRSGDRG